MPITFGLKMVNLACDSSISPRGPTCLSGRKTGKKRTAEELKNENFRRQLLTYESKADTLRDNFQADIYFLVRRKGKLRVYTSRSSLSDSHWPLLPEQIAEYYPLPVIKTGVRDVSKKSQGVARIP